jgi:hypothetical protein
VNTCTPIAPVVRPIVFSTARIRDCEPLKPWLWAYHCTSSFID